MRKKMTPSKYMTASERTEKKFPDGAVLELNEHVVLDILRKRLHTECATLDKVKRSLIYGAESQATVGGINPKHLGDLPVTPFQMEMLHAAIGKMTEAEEFFEMVLAHVLDGKDFDKTNAIEEIGDGFWYDFMALRLLESSFEDAAETNIKKLVQRFPDKFDADKALVRDLGAEREILEEGAESPSTESAA